MKPYRPGTVEKYPYRAIFHINGMLTYMDLKATDEEDAREQIRKIYKAHQEQFELVKIISKL